MSNWIDTNLQLPPEREIVDTKIDDSHGERNHQRLARVGRLWFVEDGSMYVYYKPSHWRFVQPAYVLHDPAASPGGKLVPEE